MTKKDIGVMRDEVFRKVPDDEVGKNVQGFVVDKAQMIELVKDSDGKWDITVHFPKPSVSE